MKMYKFIPIICLTIFLAACSSPISQQAKEDLARPVDCSTAQSDIRILEDEKASVVKQIENGVTAVAPIGAVIGILTMTEKDKLEVGTHYYNHKINEKIAEIKRECGVDSAFDEGEAAREMFYSLDVNNDGMVVKEELIIIYPDRVFLAEKYTYFDQNGDGYITMEEFVDIY
jgi:hypothetical protein